MSTDPLDSIRSLYRSTEDNAFLITAPEDIRWACGFTGSNGVLLVRETSATLLTDSRYAVQAPLEVYGADVEIASGDVIEAAGRLVSASPLASIAVDGANTSMDVFRRLQNWPGEPRIRPYDAPLSGLEAAKRPDEIDKLRRAQAVTDVVFEEMLSVIRPGLSERMIAAEIVYRHLLHGADKMSFDPIVAAGDHGALPHARPTGRLLKRGDLVVLDFGCFVDGYASDMTRTVGLGKPEPEALDAYAIVQQAQAEAQAAARAGMRACDLDRVARSVIESAGLGEAFTHSLGHGIGLRIHEGPRIAATNESLLPENGVVTIEPGIYIPERFGVRIENAVILRSGGCDALPRSSTDLILL